MGNRYPQRLCAPLAANASEDGIGYYAPLTPAEFKQKYGEYPAPNKVPHAQTPAVPKPLCVKILPNPLRPCAFALKPNADRPLAPKILAQTRPAAI